MFHTASCSGPRFCPSQFALVERPAYLIETYDPCVSLSGHIKALVKRNKRTYLTGIIKGGTEQDGGNGYFARVLVPSKGLDIFQLPEVNWSHNGVRPVEDGTYFYEYIADSHQKVFQEAAFTVCPMAKDSQGLLHIGLVRRIKGAKETVAYLETVFGWPRHRFVRIKLNRKGPEPMPETLTPTPLPPGLNKKSTSWFLNSPRSLAKLT